MSLDSLALKIAQKDEKAFEKVYEKMNRLVFSVSLSIVKSQVVANDISQETFISVWSNAHTFRGKGFKAWILTIAKNKSINYLEKRKKEILVDFSECEEFVEARTDEIDAETKMTLRCALESLSQIDREIVLLRNSGMKVKEIAEYLNMPRGTVSWRYSEALKLMKKYMEGGQL